VLPCVAVCCRVLQCVAVYCSVLPCVAVCCSVLPCVAVCCVAVCCSVLQCVAVCCSVLQCVATSRATSRARVDVVQGGGVLLKFGWQWCTLDNCSSVAYIYIVPRGAC